MLRGDSAQGWRTTSDVFDAVIRDLIDVTPYSADAAECDGYLPQTEITRFCYALRLFRQACDVEIIVCRGAPPFYDLKHVAADKLITRLKVAREILVFVDDGREPFVKRYLTCRTAGDHLYVLSRFSPQRRIYGEPIDVASDEGATLPDDAPAAVGALDVPMEIPNASAHKDFAGNFPIDFVYTWVNGEDPDWRRMLLEHRSAEEVDWDRYVQTDELRYSLRSVHIYAKWFRTIYIVSNCAPPDWFVETGRIKWIDHSEIIPNEYLPTFNSHVIEAHLHRIEGLSENFVYMNDDVFLMHNMRPTDFFQSNGAAISRLEAYGSLPTFGQMRAIGRELQEWQVAALRGASLVYDEFGRYPIQVHQHSPHSIKRSVMTDLVERYPAAFERLLQQRFRSFEDISPTSFLFHHFAYYKGLGVRDTTPFSRVVRVNNFEEVVEQIEKGVVPPTICINDGGDSFASREFQQFKLQFMSNRFPIAPGWERDD